MVGSHIQFFGRVSKQARLTWHCVLSQAASYEQHCQASGSRSPDNYLTCFREAEMPSSQHLFLFLFWTSAGILHFILHSTTLTDNVDLGT